MGPQGHLNLALGLLVLSLMAIRLSTGEACTPPLHLFTVLTPDCYADYSVSQQHR